MLAVFKRDEQLTGDLGKQPPWSTSPLIQHNSSLTTLPKGMGRTATVASYRRAARSGARRSRVTVAVQEQPMKSPAWTKGQARHEDLAQKLNSRASKS